jgi:hypothetical protein
VVAAADLPTIARALIEAGYLPETPDASRLSSPPQ